LLLLDIEAALPSDYQYILFIFQNKLTFGENNSRRMRKTTFQKDETWFFLFLIV